MGKIGECIIVPEGFTMPYAKLRYTSEYIIELFKNMSNDSLHCYVQMLKLQDAIFPFVYGLMYITWLSFIYKNIIFKKQYFRYINIYPIIPIVMDWIENIFEYSVVSQYINTAIVNPEYVKLASLATIFKWSASFVNYVIILIGIVLLIRKKYKKSRH